MKNQLFAVVAVSVLAGGLATIVISTLVQSDAEAQAAEQRTPDKRVIVSTKALKQWSPIPTPRQLALPDPSQVYTIKPIPVRGAVQLRTPQQGQALQKAATILSKLPPVPANRIQFFDWMNADDSTVVFAGWGVFVEQVAVVPGGWHITLQVSAYAHLKNGGPASVNNIFVEEYWWANGNLQFVRGYAHPRIGSTPSISLGI